MFFKVTVFSAHRSERYGDVDVTQKSQGVTERDFDWMRCCAVFVAYLPTRQGALFRTDGTCVELGWASALKKPIILVRDSDTVASHLIEGLGAVTETRCLPAVSVLADPALLIQAIRSLII